MEWDFGESSFDRVESFISLIYLEGVFTDEQYRILMEKIKEGRQVDNMYDIPKYLIAKREGKPWIKTEEALRFRDEMKRFRGQSKGAPASRRTSCSSTRFRLVNNYKKRRKYLCHLNYCIFEELTRF